MLNNRIRYTVTEYYKHNDSIKTNGEKKETKACLHCDYKLKYI